MKVRKIKQRKERKPSEYKLALRDVDWEKVAKIFEPEKESIINSLKKEIDRYPYSREILYLLAAGVFLGGTIIFPCFPAAVAPLLGEWDKYHRGRLSQTIKRFKKQKLVEIEEENGQQIVKITEKGRTRALKYKLDEMKIKKPNVWDKKWRIVIFDIFEKKKWFREIFRARLKQLGLFRLQDSVFVFPYPCFEEIEFLRQIYGVPLEVRYVIAEKIEDEGDLKSQFNLS
ncbi:MAG: hypothetical protein ACOZBZ_04770 [Patescibacteria group bacterium]